jgi:hypothetical protein
VARDFTNEATPQFRKVIDEAQSPTELWESLRIIAEERRAQAESGGIVAVPQIQPVMPASETPPNLAGKFIRVGYLGNSRVEIVEDSRQKFNERIAELRSAGWVF